MFKKGRYSKQFVRYCIKEGENESRIFCYILVAKRAKSLANLVSSKNDFTFLLLNNKFD